MVVQERQCGLLVHAMNILRSLVTIALLVNLALPATAKETVFLGTEQDCSKIESAFEVLDFKLGDTVAQTESRKDCTFHKELPGPRCTRRTGALSKDGEVFLFSCDPAMHTFSDRDSRSQDCSKLKLNGQKPDVVYCFFEKEAESRMPVLNELFASFPSADQAPKLVQILKTKYGAARRRVLPNQTVEYQWRDSKGVLSLFVMMSSSCINLETIAKRKKSEEFGDMQPGFSVDFAKQVQRSGRSLMAESEKNNREQN